MANSYLETTLAEAKTALESPIPFQLRAMDPQAFKLETESKNRNRTRRIKATERAYRQRLLELRLEDLDAFKQEAEKRVQIIQQAIDAAAYEARDGDLSWARIGQALRLTPQGAHKRYDPDSGQRNLETFRAQHLQ